MKDFGTLYIIATPIGNLEDITYRAVKILKEVDLIAAEDTRHTLKLLNHLEISKPLISYYKQNEHSKTENLIEKLKEGKNIALVSDAGTPGISDPGEVVVLEAIKEGVEIIPIPGACAFIQALIVSGLKTNNFQFIGFLPVNNTEKEKILEGIQANKNTIILYEAPHKLLKTLNSIIKVLGNRKIVLAKEITKIHETYIRGKVIEVIKKLEQEDTIKGEYVILIEGSEYTEKEIEINSLNKMEIEEHYKYYENKGLEKKEIIKKIAKDRNINKNEIYQKFI